MKSRSGLSLIEVMIAVLVLSFTVTVFASLYPMAQRMRSKSENVTRATTLAQQKIEQVRAIPYASLNYSALQASGIIDSSPTSSPYSFTSIDSVVTKLPQGTGSLTLTSSSSDLTRVDVTVSWGGLIQTGDSVTASTWIANKVVKQQ